MKAVTLVLLVVLVGAAVATDELRFQEWRARMGKFYANKEEYARRLGIFVQNMHYAENFNHGNHTFTLGASTFADLTNAEFRSLLLLHPRPERSLGLPAPRPKFAPPEERDWSSVTPAVVYAVKNQGQCGSCWAFSAIAALEGERVIQRGAALVALSDQQLVDCAWDTGNQGCNGGWMDSAFEHIIMEGGHCSQADYPYTARDETCKKTCQFVDNTDIKGYYNIKENNSDELMAHSAEHVVSVAIQADGLTFQLYMGGVYSSTCGTNLNHGVTLVGYGTDAASGKMFWKIKNSWGASWGEKGYMRMIRTHNNDPGQCGICMAASYPTY